MAYMTGDHSHLQYIDAVPSSMATLAFFSAFSPLTSCSLIVSGQLELAELFICLVLLYDSISLLF